MFVIPKVYSFLLRKSTLWSILYWKERKVVSVVAKRSNKQILLQSGVVFSNNFLKKMFEVGLLTMFEIRIRYISLEENLCR